MKLIKCDGNNGYCGCTFISQFCPDCGKNRDEIKIKKPVKITTYVCGDKEYGYSLCDKYGIDPKSPLGRKLIYVNYEVKLVYKIVGDNLELIEVDDMKVIKKDK